MAFSSMPAESHPPVGQQQTCAATVMINYS
jgi:hypothetical protein